MARFGQAPKASKPPQQLSQALEPHTPPQQLSKASRLLGHGTSLGHTSCFYWASKLLCGTFWATSAAAFAGLRTSQPSAAAFEGVPLAWPWYLPRPHKLFLLGFETAMWHVLGRCGQNCAAVCNSDGLLSIIEMMHVLYDFATYQATQTA